MLKDKVSGIWQRLVRKYRLVFYDHESLSQTRYLMVRPVSLMVGFSAFITVLVSGTALLVFFTPAIRNHIPGYTNPQLAADYKELQERQIVLEKHLESQDSMMASFQRIAGIGSLDGMDFGLPADVPQPDKDGGLPANEGASEGGARIQPVYHEVIRVETVYVEPKVMAGHHASSGKGKVEVLNLLKPVDGIVTNAYDPNTKHFGCDLAADEKSMIRSVASGVVIQSEFSTQNGYVIGIAHNNNMVTFYKHNSRLFKEVGSFVFAGEAIAVIGNTGTNTSGLHLHFELWLDGNPVNPEDYVQFN
jgi:lipoprotein NlpD